MADEPKFDWRAFTPEDSPKTPMDLHAEARHQDLHTAKLKVGDPAFDFERVVFDYASGVKVKTDRVVRLSHLCREKPVALIFGSYT